MGKRKSKTAGDDEESSSKGKKFSVEEDIILAKWVNLYPNTWVKVAREVSKEGPLERDRSQCQNRWSKLTRSK